MTERENYMSLVRRKGFERVPYGFNMSPSVAERFGAWCVETGFAPDFIARSLPDVPSKGRAPETYASYYNDIDLKPGTVIDGLGVAHEPGSETAYHMTYMRHPLRSASSVEEIMAYPLPDYTDIDIAPLWQAAEAIKAADRIAVGSMQCTVWETAWYIRGMNELMMDMLSEADMAAAMLDRVTDNAVLRAEAYARAGADVLFLGDDVGMQRTIMMSEGMYCDWLKPRLKRVIDAARAIRPEIVVFYHSCGYVLPLIPHLIEAGIDVLDPVQPECMDFALVHEMYGDRLSFHGTIGTQTTMPFGTPREVRDMVWRNLDIAGEKGGLLVEPTHMLEPEVPVENVVAYIRACQEYGK